MAEVAGALRRHPGAVAGLGVIVLIMLAGFLAPLPHDPLRTDPAATLLPPGGEYWFGTDRFGYDVFSRTIVAARLDLPLAIAGAVLSAVIGVPFGLLASTKNPWAERITRAVDVLQAFPLIVVAIVLVALTGNDLRNVVFVIALINTPRFIRLVRSEALSVRELRFVEAARSVGASGTRIMFRHVLPNVAGTILAQLSLAIAYAIVVIAALSFLGIGIQIPQASWGAMIRVGAQNMASGQWWVSLFPGLAVFVTVLSFNAIADDVQSSIEGARG